MPKSPITYISPTEFSEIVSISTFTVRRMLRSGKIPAIKIGRDWRIEMPAALEALKNQDKGDTNDA
jgi:excisionase family DNA binding protein